MTLTIEVSPELENRIEAEARNNGVGKDEFVRIVLEEKLSGVEKKRLSDNSRIIATDLPVRDFSREHDWLEKNRDEYDGQYVALDGDKIVAHNADSRKVAAKVKKLGLKSVYLVYVEGSQRPPFISGGVW
jgi:predicted DNA-binding protein